MIGDFSQKWKIICEHDAKQEYKECETMEGIKWECMFQFDVPDEK